MIRKEIIKRTAAGLRKLKRKPDALLFIQHHAQDYTWNEEKILDIPVFHSELLTNQRADSLVCDAIFIPIFKKEASSNFQEAWEFCKGFEL